MAIEVIGSIGVGLLSGSFALLAFGGDSLVEILSGFATTLHLRGDPAGSIELGEKTERATMFLFVALIPVIGEARSIPTLLGSCQSPPAGDSGRPPWA